MKKLKFIAIDPSLCNTAIVYGVIKKGKLVPKGWKIITTVKSTIKSIRVSSDLVNRCTVINNELNSFIKEFKPKVCFAETPSGSKSHNAAISYGVSCFTIALMNPPAIQLTPVEVKKRTVGKNTATKNEMMSWADTNYPDFPYERNKQGALIKARMEHVCDAIAIADAGLQTDQFKQLISAL